MAFMSTSPRNLISIPCTTLGLSEHVTPQQKYLIIRKLKELFHLLSIATDLKYTIIFHIIFSIPYLSLLLASSILLLFMKIWSRYGFSSALKWSSIKCDFIIYPPIYVSFKEIIYLMSQWLPFVFCVVAGAQMGPWCPVIDELAKLHLRNWVNNIQNLFKTSFYLFIMANMNKI